MYKWTKFAACALLWLAGLAGFAQAAANTAQGTGQATGQATVGRAATPAEIAAWNIDVRADFQGLPKGSGSVQRGGQVWDAKCASCHGSFGESNQVFPPIVGGTTAKDIATGRVAALASNKEPQRTSMMKLATVSTLWDYINRAMPWTAPKSLTTEEVYAVTAYILHMAEIVPENFTLSDNNIAEVKMPNRLGMQQKHGMWHTKGKGDVQNTVCTSDCAVKGLELSRFPASAANSHGNLAEQHRLIGPVRGLDTAPKKTALANAAADVAANELMSGAKLVQKHHCLACHAMQDKLVGPSWRAIAAQNKGKSDAQERLLKKVQQGGSGAWGDLPMPAQGHINSEELAAMVRWVVDGAK